MLAETYFLVFEAFFKSWLDTEENVTIVENISENKGRAIKSGLASEAITRVLRQLEQNSQVLRNPYNICKILVYSSFGYVEN